MKDAAINVYDWLGAEVCVTASWGIKQNVCLRLVKTTRRLVIVMHVDYDLIVFINAVKDTLRKLRKGYVNVFCRQNSSSGARHLD